MTTYVCPEYAATGLELRIIELQAQREDAIEQGWPDLADEKEREIAALWTELADLVEQYPTAGV
jgi:hypothetical protein